MSSPAAEPLADRVARFTKYARVLAMIVATSGVLAFIGWALDVPVLKSPLPPATMKVNTAVVFVLLGISLWVSASTRPSRTAIVFAVTAILLAGATASQDLAGWNLGIDELLLADRSLRGSVPGRMALTTAFCFVALGAAIICCQRNRSTGFGHLLAIGVALTGSVVCLGYLYGVRATYGPSPYTVIATHTAALLLALAVGVLFGHPSAGLMLAIASDTGGGTMARRLLPVSIFAPIAVGGLWLWGARAGFYPLEIGVSTMVVSMIVVLSIVIWWSAGDLLRTESERRKAERALQQREMHTSFLLRLSKKLEVASTDAEVMDAALEEVSSVMGYRSVWAYLLSDDGETASIIQAGGDLAAAAERDVPALQININGNRLLEELRDAAGVVVIEDARTDPRTNKEIVEHRTIVSAPMMLADRRIGIVGTGSIGDEGVKVPDRQQLDFFAAMVGHVAVAIDRIRLLSDRARAMEETRALNAELNARVIERTTQLEAANRELEAFSYSVSHDLRAPLRHIDGFSKILLDEHAESLEPSAQRYLSLIRGGALTMGRMIDDLLQMARVDRRDVSFRETDLNEVVADVVDDLRADLGDRNIEWQIEPLPVVVCDPGLVRLVFVNLLSNAVKYTRKKDPAHIRVATEPGSEPPVIVVQDNGAGFDPRYADKLFGVFQRLHRAEDFEGTGIGLATVQRIVQKHGGRVWADAKLDQGATFSFTLSPAATSAEADGVTLEQRTGDAQ